MPFWVWFLATWFGSGEIRPASGTWGSLAALPFAFGLAWLGGPMLLLAASAAITGIGIYVSKRYSEATNSHDSGRIVIDEVAGQWLALVVAPLNPAAYAAGFVLFRLFDIVKPWPASWIDKRLGGGSGIVLDDVVAGLYAAIVLTAIGHYYDWDMPWPVTNI